MANYKMNSNAQEKFMHNNMNKQVNNYTKRTSVKQRNKSQSKRQ